MAPAFLILVTNGVEVQSSRRLRTRIPRRPPEKQSTFIRYTDMPVARSLKAAPTVHLNDQYRRLLFPVNSIPPSSIPSCSIVTTHVHPHRTGQSLRRRGLLAPRQDAVRQHF
jgi:hypothetical protein